MDQPMTLDQDQEVDCGRAVMELWFTPYYITKIKDSLKTEVQHIQFITKERLSIVKTAKKAKKCIYLVEAFDE